MVTPRGVGGKVVVIGLKLPKSFRKDAWQQGVPSQLISYRGTVGAHGDCGCRGPNQNQKHRTLRMLELERKAEHRQVHALQGRSRSSP